MANVPRLLTRQEAAKQLGISDSTLMRMVELGQLKAVRFSHRLKFPEEEVIAAMRPRSRGELTLTKTPKSAGWC